MEEAQDYYHFLHHLFSEEIYLVDEPEITLEKQNRESIQVLNEPKPPTIIESARALIEEKEGDRYVFVLEKSLSNDVAQRFNAMLEKLGLSENNTNIIYLTSYSDVAGLDDIIFNLKPDKFVFLGSKEVIKSAEIKEDFSVININNNSILLLPEFGVIVEDKSSVLKCWQELQKFLEVE